MPKVYEVNDFQKKGNFVNYPSWKCPRCVKWHREPIARVCKRCKELENGHQ